MEDMQRIGEVVESNTTEFVTQCYELYGSPALGSLVKAGEIEVVYGIVSYSSTSGLDPSRRSVARGQNLETEREVYESNPQLSRLLSTEFSCITVGYGDSSGITTYLPPAPPKLHSFVNNCDQKEVSSFVGSMGFMNSILRLNYPQCDDIVAAFVRFACATLPDLVELKMQAAKQIANLVGNDTRRLEGILRRIR